MGICEKRIVTFYLNGNRELLCNFDFEDFIKTTAKFAAKSIVKEIKEINLLVVTMFLSNLSSSCKTREEPRFAAMCADVFPS